MREFTDERIPSVSVIQRGAERTVESGKVGVDWNWLVCEEHDGEKLESNLI